jgi:chemotaxis protein histidine kinase CheA
LIAHATPLAPIDIGANREQSDAIWRRSAGATRPRADDKSDLFEFPEDTPHQLADLRQAARVGDAVRLTRLAHKLKGSVSNFGASRMVRVCTELETLGKNGDVGIALQLLSDLDRQFDLASTVLRSEIAKV